MVEFGRAFNQASCPLEIDFDPQSSLAPRSCPQLPNANIHKAKGDDRPKGQTRALSPLARRENPRCRDPESMRQSGRIKIGQKF
jgi:hypothetical protein